MLLQQSCEIKNIFEIDIDRLRFYYSLNIAFKDMDFFTYSDIYRDQAWQQRALQHLK